MRVMVLVKATADSEQGFAPTQDAMDSLDAMGRFNDELRAAGVLVMAEGLTPSSRGARITFDGASRERTDGPFGNPGDLVAGFWLWEVRDMAEAIAWAERCPNPMPGRSDLEIRPLYDLSDLQA